MLTACLNPLGPVHAGIIPDVWGETQSMQNLTFLWMNNCSLTGGFPDSWSFQLPKLYQISMFFNQLTGVEHSVTYLC